MEAAARSLVALAEQGEDYSGQPGPKGHAQNLEHDKGIIKIFLLLQIVVV